MGSNAVWNPHNWKVEKIVVVGAGIVGIPMAALLAQAKIRQGSEEPARVVLVQRRSDSSGWKVEALNSGLSPIGGIEPDLGAIVRDAVAQGRLSAGYEAADLDGADVILVCVQTDKGENGPDYGPLLEAVSNITAQLKKSRPDQPPLIIFESTLAPTTMAVLIQDHFAREGLLDGRDVWLGNSPNRVMPGRLVERIKTSDKIVGGLKPKTPAMIGTLYSKIVTGGRLRFTNSLTAEVVKTLENAYRDVRIAYASEIARLCDAQDLNFHSIRREVNSRLAWDDRASEDPRAVPVGGLLIPTIGVGGHCLPKDGYLLLWRQMEIGQDLLGSLILEARRVNDESPAAAISLMERRFGRLAGKSVALMGVAYRPDSEDARHSPALVLGRLLLEKGCRVVLHDFYVKPDDQNLVRSGMDGLFTQDMDQALRSASLAVFCTAHQNYRQEMARITRLISGPANIFDGCNLIPPGDVSPASPRLAGIGKGRIPPSAEYIDFVLAGFKTVELGIANELQRLTHFLNESYAGDTFNRLDFHEVQRLARTCLTGCRIPDPAPVTHLPLLNGFFSRLAKRALESSSQRNTTSQFHE
jgi:UDP-N-acetyl-D-mannosaminuronic acid dehydrogenase